MRLTADQLREARRLLGWSQLDLALAAQIGSNTLSYMEVGKTAPLPRTLDKLRTALESAGVEFITDSVGDGVRLRKGTL